MPIDTTNNVNSNIDAFNNQKPSETELGVTAEKNTPKAELETAGGNAKDTVTISDSVAKIKQVTEQIKAEPVVDMKRVEQVKKSLEDGKIALLSNNPETRLKAASNIADKLISAQGLEQDE